MISLKQVKSICEKVTPVNDSVAAFIKNESEDKIRQVIQVKINS